MQWAMVCGGKCTADPNRREQEDGAGFGVFSPPFFSSQRMQEPVISCWRQWPWSFSNIQVSSFSSAASICRAGPLADALSNGAGLLCSSCHSWIHLSCFARCVGGYKRSQGGKAFPRELITPGLGLAWGQQSPLLTAAPCLAGRDSPWAQGTRLSWDVQLGWGFPARQGV